MKRFERVSAASSIDLVNELNRRTVDENVWFSVVYCAETWAIIDYAAALVQAVEPDDFEDTVSYTQQSDTPKFA